VIQVGESAPLEAIVWTTPRERASIGDLLGARPDDAACGGRRPLLLLFYLFDWSST
jgi:hypothetical protein